MLGRCFFKFFDFFGVFLWLTCIASGRLAIGLAFWVLHKKLQWLISPFLVVFRELSFRSWLYPHNLFIWVLHQDRWLHTIVSLDLIWGFPVDELMLARPKKVWS